MKALLVIGQNTNCSGIKSYPLNARLLGDTNNLLNKYELGNFINNAENYTFCPFNVKVNVVINQKKRHLSLDQTEIKA